VAVAPVTRDLDLLGALALHFAMLSLLAIGGANAVIPEMHRQAVETAGWMTDRQFADLFAIAQVAPGPNIILVTLIGFHVAGIAGGLVATLAMCIPSCVFAYFAESMWQRYRDARWRTIVQAGMVPLSVGLVAAGALIIARAADISIIAILITIATAGMAYFTRLHPLWMFALAALLGYAGWV
jgi:chromate transporter